MRATPSLGVALGLVLALGACHASQKTQAPETDSSEKQRSHNEERLDALGDDIDALDEELRRAEVELTALDGSVGEGVTAEAVAEAGSDSPEISSDDGSKATAANRPATAQTHAPSRCERIAMLTMRICQLRDHVCALATEHEQEPRYSGACTRATQTCEQAQEASEGCAVG